MNNQVSFNERLSYYQIDKDLRTTLKENHSQLIQIVPVILDDFYKFVTSHPASQEKFGGKTIDGLKKAQGDHWNELFTGNFTQEYTERSVLIGNIHQRIGITPFLYMGGYTFIISKLTDFILDKCGRDKAKCKKLLRAVNAAIMMDMELALTSYADASRAATTIGFADNMLDKNVSLSMAVNEVAVENAGMMNSLEHVNGQAQSIAAAVEEMAAGISTISQNSDEVARSAEHAQEQTMQGRTTIEETAQNLNLVSSAVQKASERVRSLVETSQNIAEMVQSIEKIATQTNLLALNATIEAARAGEAGKGFAVVASEVKNLSSQTAQATEQIRSTIEALTGEIDGIVTSMRDGAHAVTQSESTMQTAVVSMDSISQAIDLTSNRMTEISNILSEQEAASTEVSGNVASIADGTAQNVDAIKHSIKATDSVVELIAEQITALSDFDIPNKSIRIAKSDHIVWKKRLADMMVGLESLDPDELSSHMNCRLGKWYYGEEGLEKKNTAAYRQLESPHEIVHSCGIEAVRLYNAGDKDGALAMLEKVDGASKDVVRLLDELSAA